MLNRLYFFSKHCLRIQADLRLCRKPLRNYSSLYHRFPTLEIFKAQLEVKQSEFSSEKRAILVESFDRTIHTA